MKQILLFLTLAIFLIACNTDSVSEIDNGNNTAEYLTVTYHKDEGATGNPPVDSKQYRPPVLNKITFEYDFIETFIVLDQGTMEKEGHYFQAWRLRNPNYPDGPYWFNGTFEPGTQYNVVHKIDFDPIWLTAYQP